jgi:hypothetical protein
MTFMSTHLGMQGLHLLAIALTPWEPQQQQDTADCRTHTICFPGSHVTLSHGRVLACFATCSILVAGHDTTAFMLTSALYHLSRNPDAKAKLLREIDCFGQNKRVAFEDLEKFTYAEVGGGVIGAARE